MLDQGVDKIEKELELIQFIKMQKYIKIILKTLFSKSELKGIKRNKKFQVSKQKLDQSSSSNNSDDSVNK